MSNQFDFIEEYLNIRGYEWSANTRKTYGNTLYRFAECYAQCSTSENQYEDALSLYYTIIGGHSDKWKKEVRRIVDCYLRYVDTRGSKSAVVNEQVMDIIKWLSDGHDTMIASRNQAVEQLLSCLDESSAEFHAALDSARAFSRAAKRYEDCIKLIQSIQGR